MLNVSESRVSYPRELNTSVARFQSLISNSTRSKYSRTRLSEHYFFLVHIMRPSESQSRTSTPRSFTNQTASAEDLLKSQTVGLVHLSDFRKRRAEVLEQKEREAHDKSLGRLATGNSRSATPSTGDVTDG